MAVIDPKPLKGNKKIAYGYSSFTTTSATKELSVTGFNTITSMIVCPVFNSDATPDVMYVKEAVSNSHISVPTIRTITVRRNTQNVSGQGFFFMVTGY